MAEKRKMAPYEKRQRGCQYCLDKVMLWNEIRCSHSECPYRVLDKYETYNDFMKSEDSLIPGIGFFTEEQSGSIPVCKLTKKANWF